MTALTDHPLLIAVAALIVLALLFLLLRPRQRVTLSGDGPARPHMLARGEGRGIADEAAAAASDVAGDIISAKVHAELPGASGPPDDLQLLKGVGPKMAAILNQRGITRFDQITRLSAGQIEELDSGLGAFRGRLVRDKIVDQADYLARGDRDGFEAKFGRL